jgi:predicted ArsR family transcriptional regulator
MVQQGLFDVTARKHKGNPESVAAHAKVDKVNDWDQVLALLKSIPMTAKEVAAKLGRQLNTISGRFTELQRLGSIQRTGVVRDGAAEWRFVR